MARILFFVFTLLLIGKAGLAQTGQWTWMKGDSVVNQFGVYGTKGVAGQNNKPSGREGQATWTDLNGNLWVFGGVDKPSLHYAYLNDLWKYDPVSNEWTWIKGSNSYNGASIFGIKGVGSPNNTPSARRDAITCVDQLGNLWLFGGLGVTGGGSQIGYHLNDLWKYDVANNEWILMADVADVRGHYGMQGVPAKVNKPGARSFSCSWIDTAHNYWLFGGSGYDRFTSGVLNDLWKYNPTTDEWEWLKGDSVISGSPIYGTQGIATQTTTPGARSDAMNWIDATGNLWMFGGYGYSAPNTYGFLEDIWKYNQASNRWTWIKGSDSISAKAVYGNKGIPASFNTPGSRTRSINWFDTSGSVWFFGGAVDSGALTDIWKYIPSINNWVWMDGDSSLNPKGYYGSQGIASSTNRPGGRITSNYSINGLNDFFLFGGYGKAGTNVEGELNDIWRYSPFSTLPVHLLTFTAKLQNENINLNWQVENEQNFDRYEVERSNNSREFNKIGTVKAINAKEYSFVDAKWQMTEDRQQTIYYRLKMLDRDGKFSYSKIQTVTFNIQNKAFTIYPNPATTTVTLLLDKNINDKLTVEFVDATGNVMMSKRYNVSGNNLTISTQKLAAGSYHVRLLHNDEQYVQKLVIVK